MRRITRLTVLIGLAWAASAARAADVTVGPGASVQRAIDAAADGATIRLAAGTYGGRVAIAKPLTLVGAGWDQTFIEVDTDAGPGHTDAEKISFATRLEAEHDPRAQMGLIRAYLSGGTAPTVTVRHAAGVTLSGLSVRGTAGTSDHAVDALVRFEAATDARVVDCGLVGPAQDGIDVADGSDVTARHCLVAAVWGTGVTAHGASVHLADCDVRNCYYAGVRLGPGTDRSTVDRCRISGAAWHGIRYDDAGPTITGNLIFGNARCGIYASGRTAGTVRGNVFWRNEMEAVSCWFANADTVDHNTMVGNRRDGVGVRGDAHPTLTANVIADGPVGIECTGVSGRGGTPKPTISGNVFWHVGTDVTRMGQPEPLPAGNADGDPHFAAADQADFAVPAGSAAGAAQVLPVASPWPVQAAERAIIPDGDTRDYSKWHKPAGMR